VVASAFSVTFVGFGSAYTFSAFFDSLQREFGASRGSVSLLFSIAGFLYFGCGALSGPLSERWGARGLASLGMAFVALGLAACGLSKSLPLVFLAYGAGMGLGVGFSYVPALGAVQRWFVRRRGLASGLAVSGIGAGTLIVPLLANWLIGALGWRGAYLALGGLAAVVGGGMSLLLVNAPRDKNLAPDGDQSLSVVGSPAQLGLTLAEAIKTPDFMVLYAACFACAFGVFVPFVHLVAYAQDYGSTKQAAVSLIGVIGISSTAGRFALGGVADRIGRHVALRCAFAGMAVAFCIWLFATTYWSLALFSLAFGLFYGGWVALLPSVVADRFGARSVSSVIGALYTSVAFGTLIGPSATGYIFDATRTYTVPIVCAAAGNVLATLLMTAGFARRS
jgi:MFS family permease